MRPREGASDHERRTESQHSQTRTALVALRACHSLASEIGRLNSVWLAFCAPAGGPPSACVGNAGSRFGWCTPGERGFGLGEKGCGAMLLKLPVERWCTPPTGVSGADGVPASLYSPLLVGTVIAGCDRGGGGGRAPTGGGGRGECAGERAAATELAEGWGGGGGGPPEVLIEGGGGGGRATTPGGSGGGTMLPRWPEGIGGGGGEVCTGGGMGGEMGEAAAAASGGPVIIVLPRLAGSGGGGGPARGAGVVLGEGAPEDGALEVAAPPPAPPGTGGGPGRTTDARAFCFACSSARSDDISATKVAEGYRYLQRAGCAARSLTQLESSWLVGRSVGWPLGTHSGERRRLDSTRHD